MLASSTTHPQYHTHEQSLLFSQLALQSRQWCSYTCTSSFDLVWLHSLHLSQAAVLQQLFLRACWCSGSRRSHDSVEASGTSPATPVTTTTTSTNTSASGPAVCMCSIVPSDHCLFSSVGLCNEPATVEGKRSNPHKAAIDEI